ncbi:MAG: sulfocyanin-like copper-binding protein [Verrucomicrobium sp.]
MKQTLILIGHCLFLASLTHGQEPAPAAAGHEHHAPATGGGRKLELVQGITNADFLRLGKEPKTVEVLLVAVYNDDNYGMNFNGYAKGAGVYTIPKGWKVHVTFINPSPVPHSLIVLEKDDVKKLQVAEPYFKGAAIEKHLQGIAFDKRTFDFVPDEAGEFAFACGFPGHTMNGHWLTLIVSDTAEKPTLKLGEEAAQEAGPAK